MTDEHHANDTGICDVQCFKSKCRTVSLFMLFSFHLVFTLRKTFDIIFIGAAFALFGIVIMMTNNRLFDLLIYHKLLAQKYAFLRFLCDRQKRYLKTTHIGSSLSLSTRCAVWVFCVQNWVLLNNDPLSHQRCSDSGPFGSHKCTPRASLFLVCVFCFHQFFQRFTFSSYCL